MAGRRRLDRRAHVPTRGARERMRRRIANSGRLVGGWLDLAIDAEGSLVGEIDARHPPRAMPPGVFELGIALFDEEVRGRGYGTEAIALLTAHLFAELGAERVQASTAVDNSAMRRVFEKLGFAKEGVMRSYMPAGESRDDYVLYAVTRADWTAGR
jgi:RimJ/RimL family protein N-acetyltransferase